VPRIGIDRDRAAAFVESYRRAWEEWDFAGFAELFSDDVVYVAHATERTVVGQSLPTMFGRRLPIRATHGFGRGAPSSRATGWLPNSGLLGQTTGRSGPQLAA